MNQIADEVKSPTVQGIFTPLAGKPYQKPAVRSIHQLLRMQAAKAPDAPAVLAVNRAPLTYGRLLKQVEDTVNALRAFGVHRNDRVAVVLPNGPEMAVSFLVIACGATCAPLNPGYRDSEFDFYLSDLNAKALVILDGMDSPARAIAAQRKIPIIELHPIAGNVVGLFELPGQRNDAVPPVDFAVPEDVALVLHTSGTTSRPKIVPLKHSNLCSSAHNIAITLDLVPSDRCLNVMPLFHIHGLIGALLSSLTAGASVACSPGFDAAKFFSWLESFQPTWYSAVPTMHQAIVARAAQQAAPRTPLRLIRSSSAALPPPVMADLEKIFGVPVVESYGMTEASHQMASNPLPPLARKPGSVGIAGGPDMAIMDEAGNLLPPGATGEVVIRGVNVTSGYENNSKANQSSFTNGWFRTGDQGRFDSDGYLFLTSRLKEIINRGGEKIAPKEVDEVLLQHPAIAQAVAFAVPHPTLGEDIAAAVVLKNDIAAGPEEIRQFAAARLADFKVPNQVLILAEVPKGPTGKLQRIGLADKLAQELKKNFVAAESAVEKQLAEIWARILKLENPGTKDNFFAIGGDSLRASMMLLEVENRFKKTLAVDQFLRSPTIHSLAQLLAAERPGVTQPDAHRSQAIKDSFLSGIRNRLFQIVALYAPGFKTTRVWLHRMRGVKMGENVSIGTGALIETAYPRLVSIGNNVSIGMRSIIIAHLRDLTAEARSGEWHTVRIEDNAYIGPGVIILPNVTIGQGAVVSAGSVVSRSVAPQTLVQGNPAKPIARCGVSLGGGVSYEQFLRQLQPIAETVERA